ncbi:MAG: restriction endonuclease subunit S [Phycisphaera sp. RhM]|nr:restriction endonuclease subunit S [Phycisphaera sp. RhM]
MNSNAKLGDIAEFINGAAFKPTDWEEEGKRIIRIQNLNDSSKPFNRTTRKVSDKLNVYPGDLLVSWSASLGVFTWNESDVALLNQHIFRVIPNERLVDKQYLRYGLEEALAMMQNHLHGATMKHVNRGEFLATRIPLPPLPEQKRIAEILDRAEALRSQRRAALALLDELTQSIFLDMFGDPVSNPREWPIIAFHDVCDSRLGKMLDAKKQVGDNPRPYMRNINVNWGKLDLSTVWEMDFDEKDRKEFRLLPNDVLICEGGAGVAQTAVWRGEIEECYFQKSLHRVRPKPSIASPEYIAFLMRMMMRQGSELMRLVSSATIPHLTGVKLKSLRIPVPPIELQCRFGYILESIEQQRTLIHNHVAKFGTLFASLQQRAFRGEL